MVAGTQAPGGGRRCRHQRPCQHRHRHQQRRHRQQRQYGLFRLSALERGRAVLELRVDEVVEAAAAVEVARVPGRRPLDAAAVVDLGLVGEELDLEAPDLGFGSSQGFR